MLDTWTGDAVGKMHIYGITAEEVASKLGCNYHYLSRILNCRRTPKDARERVMKAIDKIIEERSEKEA